jgi:hypothetical protein
MGMKDDFPYRKAVRVRSVDIPDGRLVYDEVRERVVFLNLTAAAVLDLCDGETDVAGIAVLLQDAFHLSEPPLADVETCVQSLVSERLVEIGQPRPLRRDSEA